MVSMRDLEIVGAPLELPRAREVLDCGGKSRRRGRRHRFRKVATVPKRRGASLPAAVQIGGSRAHFPAGAGDVPEADTLWGAAAGAVDGCGWKTGTVISGNLG